MFSNGVFIFVAVLFSFSFTAFSQTPPAASPPTSQPTSQTPAAAASVDGTSSSAESDIFYLCKRAQSIRWLRAYKLENGKCKALYSKEGYLQVISSATFFASCEGVLQNVKKNLEEGNFKCAQMSKASVIELESN